MKKNISSPILSVRGSNIQQNAKKMEGFDKVPTAQSFAAKVEKIKRKPQKENLQETYVSGLQDQIHYLELQLKLLKDKQVAKHSQVDQLETFFGDGIPINENILAMKNGFNNYKSMIEKKIGYLEVEKKEREGLIVSLQKKVTQMCKAIQEKQSSYKKSLTEKSQVTHLKAELETKLKHQIEIEDDKLRKIKSENRKLNEKIGAMQRARQILLLGILKSENNKMNKLSKIRESIQEKQKQLNSLCKKYEELKRQQEQQIYVIQIQQDNIRLKKKIISLEKQLNGLHIKAEEKKMQLEAKLKDRQKEIFAKIQMQKRVDGINEAIYKENNMSVEQLQRIGRERESKILQTIIEKNKKLSKYVEYYGDLQSKVEESLYSFGERKPELKRQLQLYQNEVKILENDLELQIERQRALSSQLSRFNSKSEHIKDIVPGMIEQIRRNEEKMKLYQIERQRLQQEIKMKQKQVELTQIIKCLSLEEGEICNSTNSSLQDRLIDFMRNWEQINRSS